jgi:uncharacterized protein YfbU (UPF0304 family)
MENTSKKEEHEILQQHENNLASSYGSLHEKYSTLKADHAKLKADHETLKTEHATLKTEYSENVIIQSMNDMKQRYDRLMQSTVPKHKYTLVYDKYSRMVKYFSACSILIEHILKTITKLNRTLYNQDTKHIINKIESELITTRDILEESIDLHFS